jgi:hypothetical protein
MVRGTETIERPLDSHSGGFFVSAILQSWF